MSALEYQPPIQRNVCKLMIHTGSTLPLLPGLDKVYFDSTPVKLGVPLVVTKLSQIDKWDHTRTTMRTHKWEYTCG